MDTYEKLTIKKHELGFEDNPNKKSKIQNDIKILELRLEIDRIRSQIVALQTRSH